MRNKHPFPRELICSIDSFLSIEDHACFKATDTKTNKTTSTATRIQEILGLTSLKISELRAKIDDTTNTLGGIEAITQKNYMDLMREQRNGKPFTLQQRREQIAEYRNNEVKKEYLGAACSCIFCFICLLCCFEKPTSAVIAILTGMGVKAKFVSNRPTDFLPHMYDKLLSLFVAQDSLHPKKAKIDEKIFKSKTAIVMQR